MDMTDGLSLTLGGTTIALLIKECFAWLRVRHQKTEITPTPLPVDKADKYVTRGEFNKHVEDNARDHENIFARLSANEKLASRFEGLLEGIREDLKAIKDKLFRRTK